MPAQPPVTLLEKEGSLGPLLTGLFRNELPALAPRRHSRVSLLMTTFTGPRLPEAEAQGNFYRPAKLDRQPEFTWRATGALETVVRQWRLDCLRTLGPSELNCTVLVRILDLEATSPAHDPARVAFESAPAGEQDAPAKKPGLNLVLPNAAATAADDESPAKPSAEPVAPANEPTLVRAQEWLPKIEIQQEQQEPAPLAASAGQQAAAGIPLPGNLYQDYFGFERMPFNNTPDSLFFFPTPKHQEALSRLVWAISERKGFVMISGEIGSGKSTLCRTLLAQLPNTVKTALITHTHLDAKQLVRAIAEDLGVETEGQSEYDILRRLNDFLIQQLAAGNTVAIIIDEAQNLSPQALEEVRMISNIETEQEKLIQLILLGQPELRDKLKLPEMKQLRQRIASSYHLEPLTQDETAEYIRHRLDVASPSLPLDFKLAAMREAYRFSRGVPRVINTLCDNALLTAFGRNERVITRAMIQAAAKDLELEPKAGGLAEFFKLW